MNFCTRSSKVDRFGLFAKARRAHTLRLALGLAGALASPMLLANNGDLDPSFNGGAFVVAPGGAGSVSPANAVAIQPDGRVLAGGYAQFGVEYDWALIRRNDDGTTDTSFGGGTGGVILPVGVRYSDGGRKGFLLDLVIQPNGKIVAVGCGYGNDSAYKFYTIRWNPDGTLDPGFGNEGVVVAQAINGCSGSSLALQEDGKILVAASTVAGSGMTDSVILRYKTNGHLDTSFGVGGMFRMPDSTPASELGTAWGLSVLPDGKILFAIGGPAAHAEVVKLTSDGVLDTAFGSGGIVITPFRLGVYTRVGDLSVQPDGKIVGLAVIGEQNFAVYRLLPNGAFDPGFNGQGWLPVNGFYAFTLGIVPTEQILVSGMAHAGTLKILAARFTADGQLDLGFTNSDGKVGIVVDKAPDGAGPSTPALKIQPDGRFVVAGRGGNFNQFLFARFKGDALRLRPGAFAFTNVTDVPLSTAQVSDVVTISSMTDGAYVPIQVVDGSYSINGNPFTTLLGYVKNGDQVMVEHTSAATSGTSVTTHLKVGGINDSNNPWLIRGTRTFATFTSTTQ